jgi:hypothetical protein
VTRYHEEAFAKTIYIFRSLPQGPVAYAAFYPHARHLLWILDPCLRDSSWSDRRGKRDWKKKSRPEFDTTIAFRVKHLQKDWSRFCFSRQSSITLTFTKICYSHFYVTRVAFPDLLGWSLPTSCSLTTFSLRFCLQMY